MNSAVVVEPDTDTDVEVSSRRGLQDCQCDFVSKSFGTVYAAVAQDRAEQPA